VLDRKPIGVAETEKYVGKTVASPEDNHGKRCEKSNE
jgi:hypothetical protein